MRLTIDQRIGLRVRQLRDTARLSQRDAASTCALSLNDYRAGEAGTRRFTTQELFRLCDELGVSLSDVFCSLLRRAY